LRSLITHRQTPVNIMLIEDDDGDARAVQRAFQKAGLVNTITRAVDGIEAMDRLRGANGKEIIKPPLILLVDLNMPRMGGIEFLKALRTDAELHPTIAFVFTTSNRDEHRVVASDLSVAGYFTKAAAGNLLNLVDLIGIYDQIVYFP
jgi:CheY-like chemotaxis protein